MTFLLNMGTEPNNLKLRTTSIPLLGTPPGTVFLGDYEISQEDFLFMAHYVLTNTDLVPNDKRLQFVECVKAMRIVPGWNQGNDSNCKRLESDVPPVK